MASPDLLNDVLSSLKVLDSSLSISEFARPWGYHLRDVKHGHAFVFAPIAGPCVLRLSGGAPVTLQPGDAALVLGHAHEFASAPDVPLQPLLATWFEDRVPAMGPRASRAAPLHLVQRSEGEVDRLLVAALLIEDVTQSPVLAALPRLIVLQREALEPGSCISAVAAFVQAELMRPQPGYLVLSRQYAHLLFSALLRTHVLSSGVEAPHWMRGLADAEIGQALRLMHTRHHEAWDLPALARACGLSRSGFAQRFRRLVGRPPMDYLASLRLHAAAQRLVAGEPVARVAEQVGYSSEWAFRQAFVKQFGQTPLRYGRALRQAGEAAPPGRG